VDAEGEGGRGSERTAVMSHKLQSLTPSGCPEPEMVRSGDR
jgi:hypothetical protein